MNFILLLLQLRFSFFKLRNHYVIITLHFEIDFRTLNQAAFEAKPNESICRKLARLFYNQEYITSHNQEKLRRLRSHLLEYDTNGILQSKSDGMNCLGEFSKTSSILDGEKMALSR